jgi:hypothetical protein
MRKSFLILLFVFILGDVANAQDPLERATGDLINLSAKVRSEPGNSHLSDLTQIAENRRALLIAAMKDHPDQVLKYALTSTQRRRTPIAVRNLIEENVKVSGRLVTGVADDFANHKAIYFYELATLDDTKLNLHFANGLERVFRGDLIEAQGIKIGSDVAVEGDVTNLSVVSAHPHRSMTSLTPTTTHKRVAVLLYNFENWPSQPYTAVLARANTFTNPAGSNASANVVYQQMSYGNLDLVGSLDATNGDVFGWYTIPNSMLGYPTNNVDKCGSVGASAAETLAAADGFVQSNYDVVVYGFPVSVCGYAGLGYASTPGRVYINDTSFGTDLLVHELGHAFGRSHSYALACTDASGARVAISNACVSVNGGYGDVFDYMGQAGLKGGFNAYEKNNPVTPPWLDSANIFTITNASQAGDYTLTPMESRSVAVQSLRIARGDGKYYYLEFRQTFSGPGILVRLAPDFSQGSNSNLLDTTPGSNPGTGVLDDFMDAQLTTGKTFNDPAYGISVTATNISPNASATVHVSFDSSVCTQAAPFLVASPANQAGGARQTFTYQLSLRNQDLTACYGSTYNVKISGPAKWSVTPSSFSESLMPGDGVTREFTVTPPAAVRNGNYVTTPSAANSMRKSKSASAPVTTVIN